MNKHLFRFLLLCGLLGFVYGCASDENTTEDDFSSLIQDNNIGSKWDGTDLPSWLRDRYMDFEIHETEWIIESYWKPALCEIYKFYHKGNLLLALTYHRVGFRQNYYYTFGTLCYTDDGRRVKFEAVKDSFDKNAELIWSNSLQGKATPKIEAFGLKDVTSLGWLQNEIDTICKDMKTPTQWLYQLACGYAYSGDRTYLLLDYEYFDQANFEQGTIKVRNMYTLTGEKVTKTENIEVKEENLCSQRMIEILDFLSK